MSKTYSELISLDKFLDRLSYLSLYGTVCEETFGSKRFVCQDFYRSREWHEVRKQAILRDNGCDLVIPGHYIHGRIYVHHIEPITIDDILNNSEKVLSLDNLVCVSQRTHERIHYGDCEYKTIDWVPRAPNDTAPWKEVYNG